MKIYGLLGYPLGHSFSRNYFEEKFRKEQIENCEYRNFSFENIEDATSILKSLPELRGFNITIPYKGSVIPFLEEKSEIVQKIRSCNCVHVQNEKWIGFNTDVIGFEKSLTPLLKPWHSGALVFGTGGASRAVCFVLNKLGIQYLSVSRREGSGQIQYKEVTSDLLEKYNILINTTPVGMYPDTEKFLSLPYESLTPKHLVYDLIYNPEETLFLGKARLQGAITKNGFDMLLIQAEESWNIWNDRTTIK